MSALNSCASLDSLPCYSPSLPAPSYSCELSSGERRLEHTPRPRSLRSTPTAAFIKKLGKTTLVLDEQEENVGTPSYGRQAVIAGSLCFDEPQNISEVIIKVEGKIDVTISEGGSKSTSLVNDSYTIWAGERSQGPCPTQIPFSFVLPSTYKENDCHPRPLPPSYHVSYPGVPGLFVKSSYEIRIAITRIRSQKVGFWTKTKRIIVPFKYNPRTRPHRPIVPSPCFFSSVKTSPEEWYQGVTCMKMRPNSQLQPLNCHLFVPAARIFGLTDSIPFHLQLTGHVSSLRELFSSSSSPLNRVLSTDSCVTAASSQSTKRTQEKPNIRVFLLRQISVEVGGQRAWRNSTLGEGTLSPMPPELSSSYNSPSSFREEHLDWEGELRCNGDITVGAFQTANVQVKDFIALTLSPPTTPTTPLIETQFTIPIRFVTDPWADTTGFSIETGI